MAVEAVSDEFEQHLGQLRSALAEMHKTLSEFGETRWATWCSDVSERLGRNDRTAFDIVTGAFGGMGSLNDLTIHPVNGHEVGLDDIEVVNGRVDELRTAIHGEARILKRSLQ